MLYIALLPSLLTLGQFLRHLRASKGWPAPNMAKINSGSEMLGGPGIIMEAWQGKCLRATVAGNAGTAYTTTIVRLCNVWRQKHDEAVRTAS